MRTLILILFSGAAAGIGQLFLRAGAKAAPSITTENVLHAATWLTMFSNWQIAAGIFTWIISILMWLVVLNRTELSFAYMIGSLNYIFVPLVSSWLFNENLNGPRLIGMGVIFIGVAITLYGRYAP